VARSVVTTLFAVTVETRLRAGIADPQGATIERSLPALGFDGVRGVRVGKCLRFDLEAPDESTARAQVEEMCQRFLINPVIEEASISIHSAAAAQR
jgi:phosphoribosylformylglycinamidine synthase